MRGGKGLLREVSMGRARRRSKHHPAHFPRASRPREWTDHLAARHHLPAAALLTSRAGPSAASAAAAGAAAH